VTIFPWEISYAAANVIRYRPLPIFQTYAAHSSFLDGWDAAVLNDPVKAPQFIIFDWASIDDRHPLLDVPVTALAMYKHYDVDLVEGTRALLRRRSSPRWRGDMRSLGRARLTGGEAMPVRRGSGASAAAIHVSLSNIGRLRKLLWRVDELRLWTADANGRTLWPRVPPGVLASSVALDLIPATFQDMIRLFREGRSSRPVSSIALAGLGIDSVDTEVDIEFFDIRDVPAPLPLKPLPSTLRESWTVNTAQIDTINGIGVSSRPEVIEISTPSGLLEIHGWAIDGSNQPASLIILELNGVAYEANYGLPRQDVPALFRNPSLSHTGFNWAVPSAGLRGRDHTLSIRVVTADGLSFHRAAQAIHFKVH
jgi:hypothetical protein